ncbi:MAG: ribulose-phosphate 3-epimerase [Gemmatimonadetes bacterium]|jgi:ribulose-phosphate 3-epimerase|nr:ribulose-phosphate 3-epimerase [Gemmatimonadota bacterium]|tara:strand:+ start:1689 stop:2354 length:666 start_codon:yes stop_codon:yes gene_type:complete
MKISPSILSCDFGRLADEIKAVEAGGADWIHIDVMDGHFVPNITIGPVITEGARNAAEVPLDVHLMIEAPERYLEVFAKAGADILTVHQEACKNLAPTIARIRELGVLAGVAVNPDTPLEDVQHVLKDVDLLLVMSVHPGFGGQAYIPSSTSKVRRARQMLDGLGSDAELEVDGGIDEGNAAEVAGAGATVLVAGSAIYGHPQGPVDGVRAIRRAVGAEVA